MTFCGMFTFEESAPQGEGALSFTSCVLERDLKIGESVVLEKGSTMDIVLVDMYKNKIKLYGREKIFVGSLNLTVNVTNIKRDDEPDSDFTDSDDSE